MSIHRRTRVEARVASRVPVRVHVEYDDLDDFLDDYTANVSLGGMFVERDDPLHLGTRFRLKLRIPNRSRAVETFGTVRWVVRSEDGLTPGMGIQFDELSPTDRRAVERWLVEAEEPQLAAV